MPHRRVGSNPTIRTTNKKVNSMYTSTLRYAQVREHCEMHRMNVVRLNGRYRITFPEHMNNSKLEESNAYYTDDGEDAVIQAGKMRRNFINDRAA